MDPSQLLLESNVYAIGGMILPVATSPSRPTARQHYAPPPHRRIDDALVQAWSHSGCMKNKHKAVPYYTPVRVGKIRILISLREPCSTTEQLYGRTWRSSGTPDSGHETPRLICLSCLWANYILRWNVVILFSRCLSIA